MTIKTKLNAGGMGFNHNQSPGPQVKSKLKAGGLRWNHNQSAGGVK
jgi:hypothetical protein